MIKSSKKSKKDEKKEGRKSKVSPFSEGVVEMEEIEQKIRPSSIDEVIGRNTEKKTLNMMIKSAKKRGESVDHILFYGPPGLGKTTFANAIATEIGSSLHVTSGPAIERQGDLAAILTNLSQNDVLFIDEIHRLSRVVEETLYPAMEDGMLDIVVGKGPSAKTIRLTLNPFTLIGATTNIGKLSSPMRDRFGLVQRLDYFDEDDLLKILQRAVLVWSMNFEEDALIEIAKRSRGTARVSLRLLRRVRDYYESANVQKKQVSKQIALEALELLKIDDFGFEDVDRMVIQTIWMHYGGGPVGISTLAAAISEEESTLTDVYEPFLMKSGFIKRTTRGRVLTEKAINYLLKKGGSYE
jgi:holliday junction DNA helicase RuvB